LAHSLKRKIPRNEFSWQERDNGGFGVKHAVCGRGKSCGNLAGGIVGVVLGCERAVGIV